MWVYKADLGLTLDDIRDLYRQQEAEKGIPGQMSIETATGQNRPPENEVPITPELQIERFFEALNRGDKEYVLTCNVSATTYLLETRYRDVRIRNGNFNYQANSTGIMFNPGSYMECTFTWNEMAHELIKRFGKKRKPVKMVSIDAPEKPKKKDNEMPGPAKCITGKSKSGICGAAAYCDTEYKCCAQCPDDCNGAYIKSKSITTTALAADSVTAEKIKVDDLYSLKASIAGFKISADTISHQSTTKPESGIGQTYYDTYFSSRDKRLTFRKGPGTSDYMTFSIKGLRTSSWKCLDLISDADVESGDFSSGNHHSLGYTNIYGILYVAAGLKVAGTKQAVRETENYGEKGVYCYETPTPYFGDIGSGEIAADGKCYVDIEDVLKEMINTEMQYYVFLQKRGEGDLYVSECSPDYFIVTGTPGLKFFWELKAKQKGYEYNRYEDEDKVVGFKQIAYDDEYIAETEKLIEEREEI